ncbi:MAG: hydrogenase maturation nickel metallochaperone HypA [Anaerolineae bacterium]|jgi:hydrogenase nickel incorporation protein HypA/HybF|nr:MAG: hydrogenase maturation nickel metallochaperone HypA [Anaerolineae bacterium]
MHELAITQNVLNIVLDHAGKAQATKISKIYLVIGELSSIVDESVQFYWEIIAKDTLAEQAELVFRRISASFECSDCHTVYQLDGNAVYCPACGSSRVKILSGEEFYIEAIDVET